MLAITELLSALQSTYNAVPNGIRGGLSTTGCPKGSAKTGEPCRLSEDSLNVAAGVLELLGAGADPAGVVDGTEDVVAARLGSTFEAMLQALMSANGTPTTTPASAARTTGHAQPLLNTALNLDLFRRLCRW
jgi:hypothetical protein